MRLLLDTHVLLWWLADDPNLSRSASRAIAEADRVVVSAASAWEIGVKQAIGRLTGPDDLEGEMATNRFDALAISVRHALHAAALPQLHSDPFDRMLVAQAQLETLTLVTADQSILRYEVDLLAV
ncbi:type II toxin-antitoxin system VapC family toxin [soil metagenome]